MRIISISNSHFFRFVKGLLDSFFITYIALYCIVRLFRHLSLPIPWVNDWLTDLLFIPVVAHFALMLGRYILPGVVSYVYPLFYLLLMALYTSLVFEFILPRYVSWAVADWKDVMAYLAGAFFYYKVHQPLAGRSA